MKLLLSAMVSGLARLCMGLDPDAPGIQEKKEMMMMIIRTWKFPWIKFVEIDFGNDGDR